MNLRSMLTNIRIRLGDPNAQQPSDRTLLLLLSNEVQNFLNEANLSGRHWAVDTLDLVVVPNTTDYLIPNATFGKALEVYTIYPQDPGHITRDITIADLGDINFDWGYPANVGSGWTSGSPHSAQRMAFYRQQSDIKVKVQPMPAESATYRILYQVGVYGEATPLDEYLLIPEHHGLIEVRTMLAVLPHATWSDDEASNTKKREQLALATAPTSARLEKNFRSYITSITGKGGMSIRYAPVPYD